MADAVARLAQIDAVLAGDACDIAVVVRVFKAGLEGVVIDVGPVSYTHLDVYKRQLQGRTWDETVMAHLREDPDAMRHALDVYKRQALEGGGDVERLIRRVPVKPGDVYYMPSGMVHAIGGGILLYEIQQSSDVTYRLWDFDRVNACLLYTSRSGCPSTRERSAFRPTPMTAIAAIWTGIFCRTLVTG